MRRRDKRADGALRDLEHADPTVRTAAANVLVDFAFDVTVRTGRPPRRQIDLAYAKLRAALANDASADVRLAAAYALSHWHEARAARALLLALEKRAELPNVRGQAAEGIGWTLGADRGDAALRERAVAALRAGLDDAAAEVRFWCVYAAGHLVAKELRDKLAELAEKDGAVCPGMWAIKDEAADVIAFWDGGGWADRSPDSITAIRLREG
jgi:HEAT repeat protein